MIRVQGLNKNYGDVQALNDVSFVAEQGEVLGVLGLNGAGKSTLLRILAGDLTPSSGSVQLGQIDLHNNPKALRAAVGYLPETAPVYRDMKVRDFLRYMGRLNGIDGSPLEARIDAVAAQTNIEQQLNRIIGELSMGYRKRVGIAQAVLHDPGVVILDEPVSSLDPREIVGMRSLVRSLGGRHTVLVSSHILHEVEETCDRILVLHEGKLVAEGTEEELTGRSQEASELDVVVNGSEEKVLAALQGLADVTSSSERHGYLELKLTMSSDRREEIAKRLIESGVGLRSMNAAASGLEEVFLNVVREGNA